MASIKDNIRKLREEAGLSQEELGDKIGKTRSAISQYESGKIVPRMGVIEDLATFFHVQKSEIIGDQPLIIPGARRAVPAPTVMVPVLGRVHAGPAGDPEVFTEDFGEAEILSSYFERDPEVHVLDYEGDCMNRAFGEGTTSLVVSPNSPFGNGDIVVAVIDGTDYVVRKLEQTARELRLKPCSWNPEHEDIVVARSEDRTVEFKGKVLECFKRFE